MKKEVKIRAIIWSVVLVLGIISVFFDKQITMFFQAHHTHFLNYLFGFSVFLQIPGILVGFLILIIAVIFFLKEDKMRWVIRIISAFISTTAFVFILKTLTHRPRPYVSLVLDKPPLSILGDSFPSAHAAVAFAMLPFFEKEYPKLKYLWIVFAVIICIIRLYFPAHYLSDILLGSFTGYFIGYFYANYKHKKMVKDIKARNVGKGNKKGKVKKK
jgi:undecaprenyl-diphosphatase